MFGCNIMEMFGSFAAMFLLQGNVWSFHNYIMVASRTECCTTGSVFFCIPCSLTFPCWPWNSWIANGWKNSQYNTAGACLKWFYAAHEVLKLILCIGASFQVLLGTLAIPKYAKVLLCSVCFFTVLLDRFATASSPNWLGQYFCAFPAACSILTLKLVVKAMKTWPIQDGRRLTEHSKNYDSAGDWLWSQSQHLISLFLCFLGVGAEACWVWAGNRSAKFATVRPPAVTKHPSFRAGARPFE